MNGPPELILPAKVSRDSALPPLGLIPSGSMQLNDLEKVRRAEKRSVHLVFPLASAREAENLGQLLTALRPLQGKLIDQVWVAYGGSSPQRLNRFSQAFPEIRIFPGRQVLPQDQEGSPPGKGATMRAFLYHLITSGETVHPRSLVAFLDADIRPRYFHPCWVVDPVGAILWFHRVEAAKIVYQRPRGGRLNAMLRSLLALCPDPGVQDLQKLAYLLSGEMAGTLNFWTSLPFKSGYGVETMILLALALNRLHLVPGTRDLEHLVQVYVGQMDHRHAPLTSTFRQRGLDQMAATVFQTVLEVWQEEGWVGWHLQEPRLRIPVPEGKDKNPLSWLEVPVGDVTFPPLKTLEAVRVALAQGDP